MEFYSPLRYPGGKGKIASFFKKIFRQNLLYDCTYVEPYAGGASVALSLLINEYSSKILINDIDPAIYSFWYSVLNYTEELNKLIYETPLTVENWRKQKRVQQAKSLDNVLGLGFSTFFLNRTNRSGIINAGVIGGFEQTGKWKIDARFNRTDLVKRVERIALYKDRITLSNVDAVSLIKKVAFKPAEKIFFYLDPPYFVKGKELYLNFYNLLDHQKVAEYVKNLKAKWIVTYDCVGPIRTMYSRFRQRPFVLNYSAGKALKGRELMIFSDDLFISEDIMFESLS